MKSYEQKYQERKKIQKNLIAKALKEKKPFFEDEGDDDIFEKEMLEVAKGKKRIDVLEWGTGYSTKYYSDVLAREDINFTWDSVEYDKRWAKAIGSLELEEGVIIYLFDEEVMRIDDRRALRSNNYPMKEYINFPITEKRKYDLILVDGEKRVPCLRVALKVLKKDGIVILHDAQRKEYREGMSLYNGKHLSEKLWIGRKKQYR